MWSGTLLVLCYLEAGKNGCCNGAVFFQPFKGRILVKWLIDLTTEEYFFIFFLFNIDKILGCFHGMFLAITDLHCEALSYRFAVCG